MDTFLYDTIVIKLNTSITISGYSKYYIKYKRPDGQQGIWVGAMDTDNKSVIYTTLPGDLCIPGKWSVQAHVEVGTTALHGSWANFDVKIPGNEPHSYLVSPKTKNFLTNFLSSELS